MNSSMPCSTKAYDARSRIISQLRASRLVSSIADRNLRPTLKSASSGQGWNLPNGPQSQHTPTNNNELPPAYAPINHCSIYERRKACGARAHLVPNRRKAQHDVEVLAHFIDKHAAHHVLTAQQQQAFARETYGHTFFFSGTIPMAFTLAASAFTISSTYEACVTVWSNNFCDCPPHPSCISRGCSHSRGGRSSTRGSAHS